MCGTVAPGWLLLLFALGLLAVLVPLQRATNAYMHKLPPVLGANLPVAFAQCFGWALGAASVQFLEELDHYGYSLSACSSCNLSNAVACTMLTLCTAALMVLFDPVVEYYTAAHEGKILLAFWQLASRGLKYNVMILWTYVGTHTIEWGVSVQEQNAPVFGRLLVTCAFQRASNARLHSRHPCPTLEPPAERSRWLACCRGRCHLAHHTLLDRRRDSPTMASARGGHTATEWASRFRHLRQARKQLTARRAVRFTAGCAVRFTAALSAADTPCR